MDTNTNSDTGLLSVLIVLTLLGFAWLGYSRVMDWKEAGGWEKLKFQFGIHTIARETVSPVKKSYGGSGYASPQKTPEPPVAVREKMPTINTGLQNRVPKIEELRKKVVPDRNLSPEEIEGQLLELANPYWTDWYNSGNDILSFDWWITLVNDLSNGTLPHLMVVGDTGSGKTETVKALITELSQKGGEIIIIDPHASPDWGLPAVGTCLNFKAIDKAFSVLQMEMLYRFGKYSQGQKIFKPLFVVVDEYPAINTFLKDKAQNFMKNMVRQSRKVGIHLIILTQSKLVKTLGLEGEGDTRDNYAILHLGKEALKLKGVREYFNKFPTKYPAALEKKGNIIDVDTVFISWLRGFSPRPGCVYEIPGLPEPMKIPDNWKETDFANYYYDDSNYHDLDFMPENVVNIKTGADDSDYDRAYEMIEANPKITPYALAKTLWGNGQGRNHGKADELITQIKRELSISGAISG